VLFRRYGCLANKRSADHRIDSPVQVAEDTTLALDGAQNGACPPEPPEIATDLATVTTAWPSLPDHIKAAILALVSTAKEVAR